MSRKILFSAVLLTFLFAIAGFAQTTASIQGTVTDSTGAAIKGARVTVKSVSQGIERTTETSDTGSYQVPALPPGAYTVEIQGGGFQTQQATNVVVAVSQNAVQNFGLKPATASEVVSVEATTPVIETTTMTVGQTIDQRTVQDIPLNGRHFVDLALLVPGTVTPPQNGFLTAPLRGQGSFAFNSAGGREDAVNFMINGINLNDMVQNQVTFQPTINTVSEFKIDNSTYSAEYGRNSGSIVNIGTRSGTNQYHGEFYDYLRNNFFDARNAFNRLNQPQAPFKRNQYGADFGGPIYKDKTFFFLSYEGVKQRQGLSLASDVFQTSDLNKIQASPNPTVRALAALVPGANGTLNGAPAFFSSPSAPVDIDQGTADISHNFSNADTLHGYYVYQHDLRGEPGMGANITGFGDTREGHRQVLTINETHVFSPNVVNEVRVGANRILINFLPQNATTPSSVGLAGALGPNLQFLPRINIQDIGLLYGSERAFPQGRGDTTAVIGDTLSYIHGRHSFKFGGEFRDFRNDNFNSDPGQITFFTVNDFINGNFDSAANVVGNVANRINENALDFFAQDSWKLKPYLTVELGLRYAWNMTPSEAGGRFVNFVPGGTNGSLLQSVSGPYAQNDKNFQPRVGFSWDLFHNSKTVLRGGYAFQVDQPITGFVTGLTSNPPNDLPITVNAATPTALSTLNSQFNGTPATISPTVIDPNFKNADVQSFNLNIQQEIDQNTSLMVGYFGNKGTHLEIEENINQFGVLNSPQVFINPANHSLGKVDPTRPFQTLSPNSQFLPGQLLGNTITDRLSGANSTYNALWITANRRLSHGLQFNASYTWSHSIDDVSRNNNGLIIEDSTNLASGRGSSDFDVRHRFVVNAIYDLPFKGNRFNSGWEIAPIVSLQSGNPFTVIIPSNAITGVGNVYANLVGSVNVTNNPLGQWITTAGFADPTKQTTLGNSGRNSFTGPGFANADLALIKNTKITERINAQFVANVFDLLNHPNYGQPNGVLTSLTSATFGTINSTRFPTGDSGSSRQMQFAIKLQF